MKEKQKKKEGENLSCGLQPKASPLLCVFLCFCECFSLRLIPPPPVSPDHPRISSHPSFLSFSQ